MAKICNTCGRQNDDTAMICAFCRTPFQPAYSYGDDQRTVVADDAGAAPDFQQSAPDFPQPAPAPAPEYAPPASGYAQPEYTQPATQYAQPEYTQPAPEYAQPAPQYAPPAPQYSQPEYTQPAQAPSYQQSAPMGTPLNMSAPRYATPIQQQPYRPAPAKKNKNLIIGISIAAAVVVITAVVLIIVLTSSSGLQGKYVMESYSMNGMTYSREQIKLSNNGTDATLNIDSNNSGTITGVGGTMQVTFDPKNKTVSVGGATANYSLNGKTLTITDPSDGSVMTFTKQ